MRKYRGNNVPKGYRWITQQIDHRGEDCLLWPFSCCTPGYGAFNFEDKTYLAHRWMCQRVHGEPPWDNYHAAHSCGNRRCVNPAHLSWKSQSENQLDRRTHGTNNKSRRKITRRQADQILALKGMETAVETAARYSITESNVRLIQDGKTWNLDSKMHIWTPEEDAKLKEALSQGHPARVVAQIIGLGLGSVTARMYRLKLRTQSGHHACRSA